MAQLHITKLPNGDELIRMVRPRDWDHLEWCGEPNCENTTRGGWRARNASVYSYQPAGEHFNGWRGACSRKHALSIWRRELGLNQPAGAA